MVKRRKVLVKTQPEVRAGGWLPPSLRPLAGSARRETMGDPSWVEPDGNDPNAFTNVVYSHHVLGLTTRPGDGPLADLRHEFLVKRGGGRQAVKLALPELRPAALQMSEAASEQGCGVELSVGLEPRTVLSTDTGTIEPSVVNRFLVPTVDSDSTPLLWRLHIPDSTAAGSVLDWQGAGPDPAPNGDFGLMRFLSAGGARGTTALVFDGDWLSSSVQEPDAAGRVMVPGIGTGELYASSQSVRGDIVHHAITTRMSVDSVLAMAAPEATGAIDLTFEQDGAAARGLAVRVVPKGCELSDEGLDRLHETPWVTDASGTVYLRRFQPGEYELRVSVPRSLDRYASSGLGTAELIITPGQGEAQVVQVREAK